MITATEAQQAMHTVNTRPLGDYEKIVIERALDKLVRSAVNEGHDHVHVTQDSFTGYYCTRPSFEYIIAIARQHGFRAEWYTGRKWSVMVSWRKPWWRRT